MALLVDPFSKFTIRHILPVKQIKISDSSCSQGIGCCPLPIGNINQPMIQICEFVYHIIALQISVFSFEAHSKTYNFHFSNPFFFQLHNFCPFSPLSALCPGSYAPPVGQCNNCPSGTICNQHLKMCCPTYNQPSPDVVYNVVLLCPSQIFEFFLFQNMNSRRLPCDYSLFSRLFIWLRLFPRSLLSIELPSWTGK